MWISVHKQIFYLWFSIFPSFKWLILSSIPQMLVSFEGKYLLLPQDKVFHKIYTCLSDIQQCVYVCGYQHINIYVMGIDLLSIFYKSYFYLICSANSNVRYILNCISSFFPHQRVKREELLCVKKSLSHFLSYCNFVYVGNTHASWCQTTRRKNLNLPYITFYFNIYPIISATKFM